MPLNSAASDVFSPDIIAVVDDQQQQMLILNTFSSVLATELRRQGFGIESANALIARIVGPSPTHTSIASPSSQSTGGGRNNSRGAVVISQRIHKMAVNNGVLEANQRPTADAANASTAVASSASFFFVTLFHIFLNCKSMKLGDRVVIALLEAMFKLALLSTTASASTADAAAASSIFSLLSWSIDVSDNDLTGKCGAHLLMVIKKCAVLRTVTVEAKVGMASPPPSSQASSSASSPSSVAAVPFHFLLLENLNVSSNPFLLGSGQERGGNNAAATAATRTRSRLIAAGQAAIALLEQHHAQLMVMEHRRQLQLQQQQRDSSGILVGGRAAGGSSSPIASAPELLDFFKIAAFRLVLAQNTTHNEIDATNNNNFLAAQHHDQQLTSSTARTMRVFQEALLSRNVAVANPTAGPILTKAALLGMNSPQPEQHNALSLYRNNSRNSLSPSAAGGGGARRSASAGGRNISPSRLSSASVASSNIELLKKKKAERGDDANVGDQEEVEDDYANEEERDSNGDIIPLSQQRRRRRRAAAEATEEGAAAAVQPAAAVLVDAAVQPSVTDVALVVQTATTETQTLPLSPLPPSNVTAAAAAATVTVGVATVSADALVDHALQTSFAFPSNLIAAEGALLINNSSNGIESQTKKQKKTMMGGAVASSSSSSSSSSDSLSFSSSLSSSSSDRGNATEAKDAEEIAKRRREKREAKKLKRKEKRRAKKAEKKRRKQLEKEKNAEEFVEAVDGNVAAEIFLAEISKKQKKNAQQEGQGHPSDAAVTDKPSTTDKEAGVVEEKKKKLLMAQNDANNGRGEVATSERDEDGACDPSCSSCPSVLSPPPNFTIQDLLDIAANPNPDTDIVLRMPSVLSKNEVDLRSGRNASLAADAKDEQTSLPIRRGAVGSATAFNAADGVRLDEFQQVILGAYVEEMDTTEKDVDEDDNYDDDDDDDDDDDEGQHDNDNLLVPGGGSYAMQHERMKADGFQRHRSRRGGDSDCGGSYASQFAAKRSVSQRLAALSLQNVTILDISHNFLTEVPFLPATLERLDVSNNRITILDKLDMCPHLVVLNARRNRIRSLIVAEPPLSSLSTSTTAAALNSSSWSNSKNNTSTLLSVHQHASTFLPTARDATAARILREQHKKLALTPKKAFDSNLCLAHIYLGSNALTSLDGAVSHLVVLETLDISFNPIGHKRSSTNDNASCSDLCSDEGLLIKERDENKENHAESTHPSAAADCHTVNASTAAAKSVSPAVFNSASSVIRTLSLNPSLRHLLLMGTPFWQKFMCAVPPAAVAGASLITEDGHNTSPNDSVVTSSLGRLLSPKERKEAQQKFTAVIRNYCPLICVLDNARLPSSKTAEKARIEFDALLRKQNQQKGLTTTSLSGGGVVPSSLSVAAAVFSWQKQLASVPPSSSQRSSSIYRPNPFLKPNDNNGASSVVLADGSIVTTTSQGPAVFPSSSLSTSSSAAAEASASGYAIPLKVAAQANAIVSHNAHLVQMLGGGGGDDSDAMPMMPSMTTISNNASSVAGVPLSVFGEQQQQSMQPPPPALSIYQQRVKESLRRQPDYSTVTGGNSRGGIVPAHTRTSVVATLSINSNGKGKASAAAQSSLGNYLGATTVTRVVGGRTAGSNSGGPVGPVSFSLNPLGNVHAPSRSDEGMKAMISGTKGLSGRYNADKGNASSGINASTTIVMANQSSIYSRSNSNTARKANGNHHDPHHSSVNISNVSNNANGRSRSVSAHSAQQQQNAQYASDIVFSRSNSVQQQQQHTSFYADPNTNNASSSSGMPLNSSSYHHPSTSAHQQRALLETSTIPHRATSSTQAISTTATRVALLQKVAANTQAFVESQAASRERAKATRIFEAEEERREYEAWLAEEERLEQEAVLEAELADERARFEASEQFSRQLFYQNEAAKREKNITIVAVAEKEEVKKIEIAREKEREERKRKAIAEALKRQEEEEAAAAAAAAVDKYRIEQNARRQAKLKADEEEERRLRDQLIRETELARAEKERIEAERRAAKETFERLSEEMKRQHEEAMLKQASDLKTALEKAQQDQAAELQRLNAERARRLKEEEEAAAAAAIAKQKAEEAKQKQREEEEEMTKEEEQQKAKREEKKEAPEGALSSVAAAVGALNQKDGSAETLHEDNMGANNNAAILIISTASSQPLQSRSDGGIKSPLDLNVTNAAETVGTHFTIVSADDNNSEGKRTLLLDPSPDFGVLSPLEGMSFNTTLNGAAVGGGNKSVTTATASVTHHDHDAEGEAGAAVVVVAAATAVGAPLVLSPTVPPPPPSADSVTNEAQTAKVLSNRNGEGRRDDEAAAASNGQRPSSKQPPLRISPSLQSPSINGDSKNEDDGTENKHSPSYSPSPSPSPAAANAIPTVATTEPTGADDKASSLPSRQHPRTAARKIISPPTLGVDELRSDAKEKDVAATADGNGNNVNVKQRPAPLTPPPPLPFGTAAADRASHSSSVPYTHTVSTIVNNHNGMGDEFEEDVAEGGAGQQQKQERGMAESGTEKKSSADAQKQQQQIKSTSHALSTEATELDYADRFEDENQEDENDDNDEGDADDDDDDDDAEGKEEIAARLAQKLGLVVPSNNNVDTNINSNKRPSHNNMLGARGGSGGDAPNNTAPRRPSALPPPPSPVMKAQQDKCDSQNGTHEKKRVVSRGPHAAQEESDNAEEEEDDLLMFNDDDNNSGGVIMQERKPYASSQSPLLTSSAASPLSKQQQASKATGKPRNSAQTKNNNAAAADNSGFVSTPPQSPTTQHNTTTTVLSHNATPFDIVVMPDGTKRLQFREPSVQSIKAMARMGEKLAAESLRMREKLLEEERQKNKVAISSSRDRRGKGGKHHHNHRRGASSASSSSLASSSNSSGSTTDSSSSSSSGSSSSADSNKRNGGSEKGPRRKHHHDGGSGGDYVDRQTNTTILVGDTSILGGGGAGGNGNGGASFSTRPSISNINSNPLNAATDAARKDSAGAAAVPTSLQQSSLQLSRTQIVSGGAADAAQRNSNSETNPNNGVALIDKNRAVSPPSFNDADDANTKNKKKSSSLFGGEERSVFKKQLLAPSSANDDDDNVRHQGKAAQAPVEDRFAGDGPLLSFPPPPQEKDVRGSGVGRARGPGGRGASLSPQKQQQHFQQSQQPPASSPTDYFAPTNTANAALAYSSSSPAPTTLSFDDQKQIEALLKVFEVGEEGEEGWEGQTLEEGQQKKRYPRQFKNRAPSSSSSPLLTDTAAEGDEEEASSQSPNQTRSSSAPDPLALRKLPIVAKEWVSTIESDRVAVEAGLRTLTAILATQKEHLMQYFSLTAQQQHHQKQRRPSQSSTTPITGEAMLEAHFTLSDVASKYLAGLHSSTNKSNILSNNNDDASLSPRDAITAIALDYRNAVSERDRCLQLLASSGLLKSMAERYSPKALSDAASEAMLMELSILEAERDARIRTQQEEKAKKESEANTGDVADCVAADDANKRKKMLPPPPSPIMEGGNIETRSSLPLIGSGVATTSINNSRRQNALLPPPSTPSAPTDSVSATYSPSPMQHAANVAAKRTSMMMRLPPPPAPSSAAPKGDEICGSGEDDNKARKEERKALRRRFREEALAATNRWLAEGFGLEWVGVDDGSRGGTSSNMKRSSSAPNDDSKKKSKSSSGGEMYVPIPDERLLAMRRLTAEAILMFRKSMANNAANKKAESSSCSGGAAMMGVRGPSAGGVFVGGSSLASFSPSPYVDGGKPVFASPSPQIVMNGNKMTPASAAASTDIPSSSAAASPSSQLSLAPSPPPPMRVVERRRAFILPSLQALRDGKACLKYLAACVAQEREDLLLRFAATSDAAV